jgi:hypothetical protein
VRSGAMSIVVTTLGLLVFVLGVLGVVRPRALLGLVDVPWRSRAGLYLAVALRAVLGILLLAAATSTRFPWTIGALGIVSLAAAVSLPLLGYERLRKFVEWWLARPDAFTRAWSLVACAFGAFLVYAAV